MSKEVSPVKALGLPFSYIGYIYICVYIYIHDSMPLMLDRTWHKNQKVQKVAEFEFWDVFLVGGGLPSHTPWEYFAIYDWNT